MKLISFITHIVLIFTVTGAWAKDQDVSNLLSGDYKLLSNDAAINGSPDSKNYLEELEQIFPPKTYPNNFLNPGHANIMIENGQKVPSGTYQGLFRKRKNKICTVVLVGPRAAIAAAHCFPFKSTRVIFKPVSAKGICRRHPGWPASPDKDLALCGFEKAVNVNHYEALNIQKKIDIGKNIVMMGYGCTQQGGPISRKLRMGRGRVSKEPPSPPYPPAEKNTVYVKSNAAYGGTALCKGDSGGPTFLFEGDIQGPRQIVGINSRVTVLGNNRYSYISSTGTQDAKKFIKKWVKRYKFKVCGVNLPSHKSPCRGF